MLEKKYLDFFNEKLAQIKHSININIPIIPCDHDTVKGYTKALGICYANENMDPVKITIDEYFIQENCNCEVNGEWWTLQLNGGHDLIHTICHEIAHTKVWRHGKKHTELTNYLISIVKTKKPHEIENFNQTA